MPSLNRINENTYDNFGTQTTRVNFARHKKIVQLQDFSVLNFRISQHVRKLIWNFTLKKHSLCQPKSVYKWQFCPQVFAGFHSVRLHRQNVHNAQGVLESKEVDVTKVEGPINDESLKEELQTCKFFLVDS